MPFAIAAAAFFLGVAVDFIFNGVFKIVWIVIYGPAYIVAAKVLSAQLARTRWSSLSPVAIGALFAGAFIGHVAQVGRTRTLTYSMKVVGSSPIRLASTEWSQKLVLSSEKLKQALARKSPADEIPVTEILTTDYGCIRKSAIDTVAGVDVRVDPDATWVWKTDPEAPAQEAAGPGAEDRDLPWCRIKFYR